MGEDLQNIAKNTLIMIVGRDTLPIASSRIVQNRDTSQMSSF